MGKNLELISEILYIEILEYEFSSFFFNDSKINTLVLEALKQMKP